MVLLIGLLFLAVGLLLTAHGSRHLRNAYRITTGDPLTPRDVSTVSEPVELTGTARPVSEEAVLETPVSQVPALGSAVRVQRYRPSTTDDRRGGRWETVDHNDGDERSCAFVVDDGSVRAEIDPQGATFELGEWRTEVTDHGEPDLSATAVTRSVGLDLQSLGEASDSASSSSSQHSPFEPDRRFRVQERRLEPGDDVHVYGGRVLDRPDDWGAATDVVIGAPENTDQYLVTTGDETTAARAQFGRGTAYVGIGAIFTITGIALPLLAIAF